MFTNLFKLIGGFLLIIIGLAEMLGLAYMATKNPARFDAITLSCTLALGGVVFAWGVSNVRDVLGKHPM